MKPKPPPKDWHRADIIAAVRKSGTNFKRLSIAHGYEQDTLYQALHRRYPKAQGIVAAQIGVAPEVIWPSRYPQTQAPQRLRASPRRNGTPRGGAGNAQVGTGD